MTKQTAFLSIAFLSLGALARAEDASQSRSDYSVTADFPYVGKYVFRGVELARDSVQPSIEVAKGDFYLGLWGSQPFRRSDPNEVDLYGGYKLKLTEGWEIDTGATLFCYPRHRSELGERSNTTELKFGVNGDIRGIQPGLFAYYDTILHNTTLQAQVGYGVPVERLGLSLDFSANVGRVFERDGACYNYWYAGVDIPYKLRENSTFYVGVAYTGNDYPGEKSGFVVFRTGLALSF